MSIKEILKPVLKPIACWGSWCLIALYVILPTWFRLKLTALFSFLALNVPFLFALRMPPMVDSEPFGDTPPDLPEDMACVLFSGGSDSTLNAALMAEHFGKVHLVTYKHCGITSLENSFQNLENLRKKYGEDKFVHHKMDIDPLFQKFYFKRMFSDLGKYKSMAIQACGTCKFVMHMQTIMYCLEHGIKYVSDGSAKFYGMVAPNETKPVLEMIKKFYRDFEIEFIINPAYSIDSSQHALADKGIISREEIDRKMDYQRYKLIQPICHFGIFFILVSKTYFCYRWGVERLLEEAKRYYRDMIPRYSKYIREKVPAEK